MSENANEDFSELKSFISGSLRAVMEGITESGAQMPSAHGSGVHKYNAPEEVSFDIAVSAERSGGAKGGFSLKVLSVGAEAGANIEKTQSTVTRIQFAVRTEFKSNDSDKPIIVPSKGVV
ncbi:MAG: trypco2 family protein [Pseudomonadota bacterium]